MKLDQCTKSFNNAYGKYCYAIFRVVRPYAGCQLGPVLFAVGTPTYVNVAHKQCFLGLYPITAHRGNPKQGKTHSHKMDEYF